MIKKEKILDTEKKIIKTLEKRDYAPDKKERIRIASYLFEIFNNDLEIK